MGLSVQKIDFRKDYLFHDDEQQTNTPSPLSQQQISKDKKFIFVTFEQLA